MQFRHVLGAVLSALMIQACTPTATSPAPAPTPSASTNTVAETAGAERPKLPRPDVPAPRLPQLQGEGEIQLERSACGFRCPVYRVSIDADGLVRYEGRAHVAVGGKREKSVDPAAVQHLRTILAAEMPALAGEYVPGSKNCGQMRTDQPSVTLVFAAADGRSYRSRRYAGCEGAPPRLADLENMVDAAAGIEEWVSGRAIR